MTSAKTHTVGPLELLGGGRRSEPGQPEQIRLHPSPRLEHFVATAAESGLEAHEAVRLGLEHALCLKDAGRFAADVEAGRHLLVRAASRARPVHAMVPAQAAYVRRLTTKRRVTALDVTQGLLVQVPDRLICRARATLPENSLHAEVVEEMISWEVAAMLCGRTMGEWALLHLLKDRPVA